MEEEHLGDREVIGASPTARSQTSGAASEAWIKSSRRWRYKGSRAAGAGGTKAAASPKVASTINAIADRAAGRVAIKEEPTGVLLKKTPK